MARTRWGDCASSSLKVNWPLASVLVRPVSSMPWPSFRRTTSSPVAGLPVVAFLTVPVRVWAAARVERSRTAAAQATFTNADAEQRENSWRALLSLQADMGSFDCVNASLCEALTSLRMTGVFKIGFLFWARDFRHA